MQRPRSLQDPINPPLSKQKDRPMNKKLTRILATSIAAAALTATLAGCGKGSASSSTEGSGEIALWTHNAGNPDELAAVQGAIWKVASGLNVSTWNVNGNNGQNSAIQGRLNALSAMSYESAFLYADGEDSARIKLLTPFTTGRYAKDYPHKKLPQSFAIAGPIPDPATWVMMIGGFAFAGAALRRSRQQKLAVVKVRH